MLIPAGGSIPDTTTELIFKTTFWAPIQTNESTGYSVSKSYNFQKYLVKTFFDIEYNYYMIVHIRN
jgi:hypothetical protein